MSLAALRLQIASVVAGAPSASPGLPTGMAALDAALPGGGVPRGRISEWVAPAGLGKTTLARHLVRATLRAGLGVAWIDATRTLDPRDWAGTLDAIWVVRPPDPARAPWCADLLLRSGAFTLVVLDGGPVLPRPIAVRLAQLARESDAALLLLGDGTRATDGGAALRLRLARRGSPGRAVAMVEKGGVHSHPVVLEIGHDLALARRLCAHPEIPDRRGVARRTARRGRRGAHAGPLGHAADRARARPDDPHGHGAGGTPGDPHRDDPAAGARGLRDAHRVALG
ncbi:MAG: hypothetical protein P3A29_08735 [Gemmatimonadota bacterium]|nr:hypothetical protein [Gemmatimonadota bacterium]MDQ8174069.1 hypothetical protein [Gemmatimonadota bacterium]